MMPPAASCLSSEDRALLADRVSVTTALLVLTPVLLMFAALSSQRLQVSVLGAPLYITFDAKTLLLWVMPALAAIGADWTLRVHPAVREGKVFVLFPFWIAPGLAAFWLALALGQAQSWAVWVLTLIFGAVLVSALIVAEYYTLSPHANQHVLARNVVQFASYLIAFASFTLIYGIRERSLVSATATLLIALALAVDLLASQGAPLRRALVFALIVAWAVGQSTWAMNYWNVGALSAGLILLGVFHFTVGLSRAVLTGSASRGVVVTHGGVLTLLALAAFALANLERAANLPGGI